MRVFLHTRKHGSIDCTNEFYEFSRVPVIGEHVVLKDVGGEWYVVQMVIHTPFEDADCVAEVYALAVHPRKAMQSAMMDAPWGG